MKNIFNAFRLDTEKEDFQTVLDNIYRGVVFKGTNLWILVFAIFIASLGLNVNSTAVIIGAMLVSPLMGPIMGLGLGMGINNLTLLKKSLYNYLFAAGVSLATSTIYFLLTPITGADSEILSRTSPNIYDVLIALFGGFAGILATCSKQKGNVIPGVAIATALMPPLCTAGYGLANFKFDYFFGAFYLFFINTVFIALATFLTAKVLKFPLNTLADKREQIIARRYFFPVVLVTLLPSIYFGYSLVQQNKFLSRANQFITNEAIFPNNYLLKKTIDTKNDLITLTYGGQLIKDSEISLLKSHLPKYNLDTNDLKINQGFAYLNVENNNNNEQTTLLKNALEEKQKRFLLLQAEIDSIAAQKQLNEQIFKELKAQYPTVESSIFQEVTKSTDSTQTSLWLLVLKTKEEMAVAEKTKIEDWLKVRVNKKSLAVFYER
jgi:uncharacterized hydrophobic protein (TIGR00271 family)